MQVAEHQPADEAGDEAATAQRLGHRETKGRQRDNGDMKPVLASPVVASSELQDRHSDRGQHNTDKEANSNLLGDNRDHSLNRAVLYFRSDR